MSASAAASAAAVFVKYTSIIWQDGGSTPTFVCVSALFMNLLISQYCVALHLVGFRGAAEPASGEENEKKRIGST